MTVTGCTDINNIPLNEVSFNDDGTVVGIIDSPDNNSKLTTKLSCECCEANGWTFDPNEAKCFWAPSCLEGGNYSIVLNPEGDNGALFQIDPNQIGSCTLELKFDWLLKFDCLTLETPLKELLEELELTVHIEKVIFDESLPIPNNLESVASKTLFKTDDIVSYLDGNENTGFLVDGDIKPCSFILNNLINDITPNDDVINDFTLNSDWVSFSLEITDQELLETIYNERLKISIEGNILDNFSILVDDVKLNRLCEVPEQSPYLDNECPKFELKRIIDNKKSWVEKSSLERREIELRNFDLSRRETNYTITDEKLTINTKEVDIGINPSQAVVDDVFSSVINNPCILSASTGCTSSDTSHECIDLNPLITIPLIEIENDDELFNMLIDVKNRKTLTGYPTLDLLFHRYKNALEHCGIDVNIIDDGDIDAFINLIGTYWSDLIEQLIPATTIWGSYIATSDNRFISSNNKFKYRKYSLFPCDQAPNYPVTSPSIGDENVEVKVEVKDIIPTIRLTPPYTCSSVGIRQFNVGSEFIGTVTIIGGDEPPTTGSTISINETIIDECDIIEPC